MLRSLFNLMGMMFLLMLAGFILRRRNIITAEGKKCLTNIILYAILPCNIIKAFSKPLGDNFLSRFVSVLIAAILIQLLCLLIAATLYRRMGQGEKEVFQYATVCSNSGFMGNPLAEGVYGDIGLVYASVFLIPQRIVMWTAGVSYFQKGADKKSVYRKVLTHPCMVATYIGFVLMLTQFQLPEVLSRTIQSLSNSCTAMTMLYIGTILTEVDFRRLFDRKLCYFSVIRLVLIPLIVFACCRLVGFDAEATGVCTLLSATPAGSTTSLLAAQYHADEVSAARCVVLTTVLSVITIPIWSAIVLGAGV